MLRALLQSINLNRKNLYQNEVLNTLICCLEF
jgi:hypothetical protein